MGSVDDDAISRRLRDFPEIDARVREIPSEIATEWPGIRRVSLALGEAIRLSLSPTTREAKRRQEAASRLVQEPAVQEAARRAAVIAARADHWPEGRTIAGRSERDEWRRLTFEGQARQFAAAHRFSYVSPRNVRRVLAAYFAAVYRDEESPLPVSAGPTIYVNPLADADLSAPVPPGHILVDLTHASTEDLKALAKPLAALQARVGYRKPSGGRKLDDRAERCRTFQSELPRAICRARDAREERGDPRHGDLRQHELAAVFGLHEDTLKARLDDCGIDWAKTKRRPGSRVVGADSH